VTVLGGLALGVALSAAAAAPAAPAATDPTLGLARLAGQFELAGRVTVAVRIKGERAGQNVLRTWSFLPRCATGACAIVALVRERASGSDTVTLRRRSPGYYTGSGSFYAPLKCGRNTYRKGLLAPFTVTVTVTKALRDPTGQLVATRVKATYTNRSRRNLTQCVALPGHDAASYHGHVIIGSSPSGGAGT
jgi:hypothetical protein